MALINTLSKFYFPFDVYNDKIRFQYISTKGRSGFYDAFEKKFISSEVFHEFLNQVAPKKEYEMKNDHFTLEKTKNRIRKNISFVIKRPVETYNSTFLKYISNRFLRSKESLTIENAILFVDIVGSTNLSLKLSSEEMSTIIRTFSQEMSILISNHGGFVLKYAGDAVIGYFPNTSDIHTTCENAVKCAKSMHLLISIIFNEIMQEFGLAPLQIRVGIEYGKDSIVFFGSDGDLIGSTITTSSKIYPLAKPSHTAIGHKVYENLNKGFTDQFILIKNKEQKIFTDPVTNNPYKCYVSK